jgi:hypothetical protein
MLLLIISRISGHKITKNERKNLLFASIFFDIAPKWSIFDRGK